MAKQVWIIYDSRAAGGDTDEATVYETCESLREAYTNRKHWPDAVCYRYDIEYEAEERISKNEQRVY